MSKKKYNGTGQIIKFARIKAGLRQMDLAVLLGISENEMSKLETGRRAISSEMYAKIQTHLQLIETAESCDMNNQQGDGGCHG